MYGELALCMVSFCKLLPLAVIYHGILSEITVAVLEAVSRMDDSFYETRRANLCEIV